MSQRDCEKELGRIPRWVQDLAIQIKANLLRVVQIIQIVLTELTLLIMAWHNRWRGTDMEELQAES